MREQKPLLLTDTTFRDAHQSLLATRVRTRDMLRVAPTLRPARLPDSSRSRCGAAPPSTRRMRFLKEDPWERLARAPREDPQHPLSDAAAGRNAVGYTSYPDNVVKAFVKEAAQAGIDLFRVFDSLNWVPNMELSLEAVRSTGMLCEAAICYTGDILDPDTHQVRPQVLRRPGQGAGETRRNLIAIKDMAGLCKPFAAQKLVKALREEVGIPIHFHTHDMRRRCRSRRILPRPKSASTSPTAPSRRWPA